MPIPDRIDVYFDERQPPVHCHSLRELEETLDRLHAEYKRKYRLVIAIKVFGHEIDTGLASRLTFIQLQIDPCDGEYYLAVGDEAEDDPVEFYGAGDNSFWETKNLIPLDKARDAILYFVEHQRRSPSLRWQDWSGRDV